VDSPETSRFDSRSLRTASRRLEKALRLMYPTTSAGSRMARIKMTIIFRRDGSPWAISFIADPAIEARSG